MTNRYRARSDTERIYFTRDNGAEYGYVETGDVPFQVRLPDGELIGTVDALCDALPLILDPSEQEYLRCRQRKFAREKEMARWLLS